MPGPRTATLEAGVERGVTAVELARRLGPRPGSLTPGELAAWLVNEGFATRNSAGRLLATRLGREVAYALDVNP